MQHFVRYARFSFSGTLLKPGWRICLFAAPGEAREFAEEFLGDNWRVETGNYDGAPAEGGAPRDRALVPRPLAKRAQWRRRLTYRRSGFVYSEYFAASDSPGLAQAEDVSRDPLDLEVHELGVRHALGLLHIAVSRLQGRFPAPVASSRRRAWRSRANGGPGGWSTGGLGIAGFDDVTIGADRHRKRVALSARLQRLQRPRRPQRARA